MSTKSFNVRLTARIDEYEAAMKRAKGSTKDMADSTTAGFARIGQQAQQTGMWLTTRVTAPLVGLGAAGVKMAVDFDSSMTRIQSLVGLSAEEVDGLRDSVMELSGRTAAAPRELGDALFFATSAGLSAKQALEAVEWAAKASAVGLGETSTIVDLTTSAMNAYGEGVLSAQEATDALTMAVRLGKLEPAQLAGSMGAVLPIASAMGVEFHEVGAAFAAMSRTGTNASEAATQLRSILSGLLSPSQGARDALASVGLSVEGVQSSLRDNGLLATLEMLVQSLGGNAMATEAVFGNIRALSGVMDMLGGNVDGTRQIFDGMNDSVGVTAEAFDIAAETTGFKLQQAMADLQSSLIAVGDVLMPLAAGLAEFVSDVAGGFASLPDPVQKFVVAIAGVAAVAGPALWAMGSMVQSAIALKGALAAISLAGAMNPLGAALLGLGAAFAVVTFNAKRAADEAKRAAETHAAIEAMHQGIAEQAESFFSVLSSGGDAVDEAERRFIALAGSSEDFREAMDRTGFSFRDLAENAVNGAGGVTRMDSAMSDALNVIGRTSEAGMEAWSSFSHMNTAIGDGVTAWGDIQGAMSDTSGTDAATAAAEEFALMQEASAIVTEVAQGLIEQEFARLEANAEQARDRVNSAFADGARAILEFSDDGKNHLGAFVSDLEASLSTLTSWQDDLVTIAARGGEGFATEMAKLGPDFAGVVGEIADASDEDFAAAMSAMVGYTEASARDMATEFGAVDPAFQAVIQGVASMSQLEMIYLQIQVASQSFRIGQEMTGGMELGVLSKAQALATATVGVVEGALADAKIAIDSHSPSRRFAREIGEPIVAGIEVGILDSAGRVSETLEAAIEDWRDAAVQAAADMISDVQDELANVWAGIDDRRRVEALEATVADREGKLNEALDAAAEAAREYGVGSEEHRAALEDVAEAQQSLEDANYRLLKAMEDAFAQGEMSEEQFRELATAAGLERSEIDSLIDSYERLTEARAEAARAERAAEQRADNDQRTRTAFEAAVAAGKITADELNHLAVYGADDPEFALHLMREYLANAAGRRLGGPVRAGVPYRVGEENSPELLSTGAGRQFLIPGDQGKVTPLPQRQTVDVNQMDPEAWGRRAAQAYRSEIRVLSRAG